VPLAPAAPAVPQVAPAPAAPAPVSSPGAGDTASRAGDRVQGPAKEKPSAGNDALGAPAPAVAPALPEATIPIAAQAPSAAPAPVAAPPPAAAAEAPSGDAYEVRPGDTLWSIAARLAGEGATAGEIAGIVDQLWGLNADRIGTGSPDLIMAGTVLALPKRA
jgi:resuscitation-promoting factor RpfA